MKETWKTIPGYEDYEISNWGRIKRIQKQQIDTLGRKYNYKERILKQTNDKDGYLFVSLRKDKKDKCFRVHRLVASAFIPNVNNYPQVNHKDENKANNRVDNLEWCDNKYNCNYGNRTRKISNKVSKFMIIQKDLQGNLIKVWDRNEIYDLTKKYNYQRIRDQIRKNLKPKEFIWERIDLF